MGDYEQFTFKGWNDETVYAYLVKPVDFDPAKKYPVAFLIHGGPQGHQSKAPRPVDSHRDGVDRLISPTRTRFAFAR